jgi:hypothetical protein
LVGEGVTLTLDPKRIQALSEAHEQTADEIHRAMGYVPRRVDRRGKNDRKRPEGVGFDGENPAFVYEVKDRASAGFIDKGEEIHASTLDEGFLGRGVQVIPIHFGGVKRHLRRAVQQYETLVADRPEYEGLPFVVAFFFDFFADVFPLLPKRLDGFPQVSALVTPETDWARRCALVREPLERVGERVRTNDESGLPPSSLEWRILENETASVKMPRRYVEQCIPFDAELPYRD